MFSIILFTTPKSESKFWTIWLKPVNAKHKISAKIDLRKILVAKSSIQRKWRSCQIEFAKSEFWQASPIFSGGTNGEIKWPTSGLFFNCKPIHLSKSPLSGGHLPSPKQDLFLRELNHLLHLIMWNKNIWHHLHTYKANYDNLGPFACSTMLPWYSEERPASKL